MAPSSFFAFSAFVNYLASYKDIVQLLATWLLTPVLPGLLLAIPSAFVARRRAASRAGSVALANAEN